MKLIYTNENRLLVSNLQNILQNEGIATCLKNEFASGASGDLSFLSTWPEIWVLNEADYLLSLDIIHTVLDNSNTTEWCCSQCGEINSAPFDYCWNCQNEKVSV